MIYGYARVSTKGQELESQLIALKAAGCEQIFQEKITGTKADREEFQKVLALLKEGDKLVVTKLDRFARSTLDAIGTIKELFTRSVAVHILNMGLVENNPAGRLIFNVMSCFAEFERDIILERTATGKVLARERPDFYEGRPPLYKRAQKEHALKLLERHTYTEVEAMTGMSRATLIRARRKQKAQEVQNIYDRGEIV
jgi:DNA invertase Pin-like site-specific DNA recombinase